MGDHKTISIFAAPPSYKRSRLLNYPHILRGSSMIRGEQVATALGARFNLENGHRSDIRVYVKPNSLDHIEDGSWVDIVDGLGLIPLLKDRPGIKTITVSEFSLSNYRNMGMLNEAVVIHPHHCNFGRERRSRNEVLVVGYIGSEVAFSHPLEDVKRRVDVLGMEFVWSVDYRSREDIVEFYKQIDIQLVWANRKVRRQSIGPTKAVNAASFGIPTVAYPQVCYSEIDGKYIQADTIDSAMEQLRLLRDDREHYESWASKTEWTEAYHIDNIAERYRKLR